MQYMSGGGRGLRLKHPETIPKIIPQGWLYG